jgi:hypothetical protein
LVAIFAALYYILSLISPKIPAIGLADLKISLEALMASVFGFVLGPYLGALAALLGASITFVLPPVSTSPLAAPFLLSPPINALIVGLVFYRKWKWGFALFSVLIAAFLFLPPSQPLNEYYYVAGAVLWDKIIALALIIPTIWLSQKLTTPKYLPILFFLLSFIGNQADNMWGVDIFAVPFVYSLYGVPNVAAARDLFLLSPFIYPAIRFVQALLATIIAVPLMIALKNTKWTIKEESIIEHDPQTATHEYGRAVHEDS